jgi:hypothetical protein
MPFQRDNPVTICRQLRVPLLEAWASGKQFI